ncbi:MAG: DUF2339 domain-containing protein [Opitutales bacterium]|nr:DUF2339 domain-containing protein [Opitutales bacterium]MDP4777726.1 DUF2339 domain-containing protein [Opitutales bacterium]
MELLAILILCALLAAMVLPWVNLLRHNSLRGDIERLTKELERSRTSGAPNQEAPAKVEADVKPISKEVVVEKVAPAPVVPPPMPKAVIESVKPVAAAPARTPAPEARVEAAVESNDWFSKVAVWVGGVALLMAGFYMVKYSIESGWLTPMVRLWLTAGFGVLLCGAGFVISVKSKLAGNERIGQALSGAGVACLYFAAYAAVHLYGFLSPTQGFISMVAVTGLAVGLSLKNGAPIALMGLVGGFLTPWLMQADLADTAMLFSYLFLLFCGAQFLCMRRGWWGLLLGTLVGAYVWSFIVIAEGLNHSAQHIEGAMWFVMGICVANALWAVMAKAETPSEGTILLFSTIRLLAWGGGLLQSLALVWLGGFAGVDMALFGVLGLGALLLAVLREEEFIWAAWFALAAIAVGVIANPSVGWLSWFIWPAGLLGVFFAVGHWQGLRSTQFTIWRGLSVASALLFAPLLYLNRVVLLGTSQEIDFIWRNVAEQNNPAFEVPFSGFWFLLASVAAALLLLAAEHLRRREESLEVVGEYSCFAVAMIGFGLWTYVPATYLAHSLAGLFIVSALYWKWRDLGRMGLVVGLVSAAWGVVMLPFAADAVAYFFRETFQHETHQDGVAVLAWLCGAIGSVLTLWLGREEDGLLSRASAWCSGLVALLGFVALYQWLDQSVVPESWTRVMIEGGLTALLAVFAVVGRAYAGRLCGGRTASLLLSVLVAIRVVFLHLADSGAAGESFFFNALLLQFGVPFFAAFALAWFCGESEDEVARRLYQLCAMMLGFVWSTFLVQDYFGGQYLFSWKASSAEVYTYSVVWLLLAVAYQAIGLWRNQQVIHTGSLVLLLVTVGKVFLVDASELEGIFRVFSFLGLGVALMGIGFFYNKVVFAREKAAAVHRTN